MSVGRFLHFSWTLFWVAPVVVADDDPPLAGGLEHEVGEKSFRYGKKGLEFESKDGSTFLWFGVRLQGRYDSLPGTLDSADSLRDPGAENWDLKRGRFKGGGHVFSEAIQIYSEYDFTTETLLDYRVTFRPSENLGFRVGQWKAEFNRERIDSSGKQQFVDRSIANYWFTLDRQFGLAAGARLWPGETQDSMVWLEYLSGQGRGRGLDDDSGLWMLRWQWNPHRDFLGFGQGDLDRRETPISGVTLAAVHGDSPYTRYSSTGGGQLPGLELGDYRLTQFMLETNYRWNGFSWQQELHWKNVEDLATGQNRDLIGGYAQVGAFPSECWRAFPEPLELTARMALVDPDTSASSDHQWEWMLGANWYFNGHRNKISADVAYLDFDDPDTGSASDWRFRIQWDVSF